MLLARLRTWRQPAPFACRSIANIKPLLATMALPRTDACSISIPASVTADETGSFSTSGSVRKSHNFSTPRDLSFFAPSAVIFEGSPKRKSGLHFALAGRGRRRQFQAPSITSNGACVTVCWYTGACVKRSPAYRVRANRRRRSSRPAACPLQEVCRYAGRESSVQDSGRQGASVEARRQFSRERAARKASLGSSNDVTLGADMSISHQG
jgi:hypothetical protein